MRRAVALALLPGLTSVSLAQAPAPQPATPPPGEAAAPAPRFDVFEYRVLGNTTLPNATVERAIYSHLGPNRTFADIEAARQSLERVYREAGYGTVFVDVPEQSVDEGIVRLKVTEGRLDRVRITGARYFANGRIRAALPALTAGAVPKLPDVQSELNQLNRVTADRVVVPVMKAGRRPGTVDVELKVTDDLPLHGEVELNDRHTADTSRLRLNASLSYDNLFARQHSLSLQYQTAPQETSDVRAIVASYAFRFERWRDTTFALYAVDSQTDVAALGTLSVLGTGRIYGLRTVRSLFERPNYSHSFSFGLDYKDFLENIRLEEDEALVTPIKYLNWSAGYNSTLRGERTVSAFNVSANFGVRGAFNGATEFEDKRFKGAPNYFYVRAGAQQLLRLPGEVQIFGRLAGQFTQDALVSNEQFGIGGVDTVRGYLESSELGDYGASGTLELRQSSLSRLFRLPAGAAYVFAFFDTGIIAVVDPLPSQTSDMELTSWGVGFRVSAWHGLDFALDWARAIKAGDSVDAGDGRAHFSFRYSF